MTDSFIEKTFGQPLTAFSVLHPDQRAAAVRERIPDLNFFFDEDTPLERRDAPERTRSLAQSLFATLERESGSGVASLSERIVTNAFLRGEADRDQNVYLGPLFTRTLTRAVPDVIFQPTNIAEAAAALRWARENGVPLTLRGAASTAMGGSVPNDGGVTLDVSRLDTLDIDEADRVCVMGAGVRLRTAHQRLAERGLALKVYPSNLGGTFAGWFATGGIGMNAFGRGRAIDAVRAADVLLAAGEHVRFHDDGRLDVPDGTVRRRTLASHETEAWFRAHGYLALTLADLAGSEGVFGLILHLTVTVEKRGEVGAFLLSFATREDALEAADWVGAAGASGLTAPANLKYFSGSHMHHTRRVWRDEAARDWRAQPGALSSGALMPWRRIAGPAELGADTMPDREHAAAYLFVDFLGLDGARAFAAAVGDCPGSPIVLGEESVRFAAERFRPQQTKRLGPGLLAAEILIPKVQVGRFIPRAERLARTAGRELDAEVYFLADGMALVIGGYLTDHRNGAFALDLVLGPALLDLAMRRFHGRPYVLGRWQSAWVSRKFGTEDARRLAAIKRSMDPAAVVNRGVLFGLVLRGTLGALLAATFEPGIALACAIYDTPLLRGPIAIARALMNLFPGPARGRGEPVREGAQTTPASVPESQAASARALHCVNCGECNSVCPIFAESKIRLPQMLTHIGESLHAGDPVSATGGTLLDLCVRCGNCEEVCQAGIPHLPLYEHMQRAADRERPHDRERHVATLAALRGSQRYLREFLDVRPGGYQKRTPASLPGLARFVLLRAENDAGPAATCIHCGACVSVCPTNANHEFEGEDARSITTDQHLCIGCGTCVEVCPANLLNGGQTLRVVEAPTRDFFVAIEEFDRESAAVGPGAAP